VGKEMTETQKKIAQTMASVFNVSVNSITQSSTVDNVESWDSLHHMNLVIALEETFGIEFEDSEIVELMSFKLIENLVQSKLSS